MNRFTGGLLTGLALGLGAVALAPALGRWTRPAAKAAIRAGLVAFERARERLAELGETVEDLTAEVTAEMAAERDATAAPRDTAAEPAALATGVGR